MENSPIPPTQPITQEPFPPQTPVTPSRSINMKPLLLGALLLVVMSAVGVGAFWTGKNSVSDSHPRATPIAQLPIETPAPTSASVACPLDAKVCPDGSSVGRVAPNCEFAMCPTKRSNDNSKTLPLITSISKYDEKGNRLGDEPKMDFIFSLPKEAVVKSDGTTSPHKIQLNEVDYELSFSQRTGGLCPWEDNGSGCTYSDSTLKNSELLRIWRDNKGVFALNPQSIQLDGYYMDLLVVTKPSGVFSEKDISVWKNILSTISIRKSEE